MQVGQRVSSVDWWFGLGFFSDFGFRSHGERELESFKVEFKENIVFPHTCQNWFLGPMEVLSSVLEVALFKAVNPRRLV